MNNESNTPSSSWRSIEEGSRLISAKHGRPTILERALGTDSSTALFFLAYSVWLFFAVLEMSFFGALIIGSTLRLVHLGCYTLLVLSELMSRTHSNKDIFLLLGLIIIGASLSAVLGWYYLDMLVMVFCARNKDFRTIARVSLAITSICVIIVVVSSQIGIIVDYVDVSDARSRHYMGFRYSLILSQFSFLITALVLFLLGGRLSIAQLLLLVFINYLVYYWTQSRLMFSISMATLLFVWVSEKRDFRLCKGAFGRLFLVPAFLICAIVSFAGTLSYETLAPRILEYYANPQSIEYRLLQGLPERLWYGFKAINTYGISLFSQVIPLRGAGLSVTGELNTSVEYFWIDCLYVSLPVRFGLCFFAFFLISFTMIAHQAWKSGEYALLIILAFLAISFIIDDKGIMVRFNTFWLLAGSAFLSLSLHRTDPSQSARQEL